MWCCKTKSMSKKSTTFQWHYTYFELLRLFLCCCLGVWLNFLDQCSFSLDSDTKLPNACGHLASTAIRACWSYFNPLPLTLSWLWGCVHLATRELLKPCSDVRQETLVYNQHSNYWSVEFNWGQGSLLVTQVLSHHRAQQIMYFLQQFRGYGLPKELLTQFYTFVTESVLWLLSQSGLQQPQNRTGTDCSEQ